MRSYFNDLRAIRERSAEEARTFVANNGLVLQETDALKGEYCGPIIHRTERHAVQSIGHDEAVVHDVEHLDYNVKPGNDLLRVRYKDRHASITSGQSKGASKGL